MLQTVILLIVIWQTGITTSVMAFLVKCVGCRQSSFMVVNYDRKMFTALTAVAEQTFKTLSALTFYLPPLAY
jgi:hypothetical protein